MACKCTPFFPDEKFQNFWDLIESLFHATQQHSASTSSCANGPCQANTISTHQFHHLHQYLLRQHQHPHLYLLLLCFFTAIFILLPNIFFNVKKEKNGQQRKGTSREHCQPCFSDYSSNHLHGNGYHWGSCLPNVFVQKPSQTEKDVPRCHVAAFKFSSTGSKLPQKKGWTKRWHFRFDRRPHRSLDV